MILNTLEETYFLNVTINRSILEFCSLKRKHVTFNGEIAESQMCPPLNRESFVVSNLVSTGTTNIRIVNIFLRARRAL